MPVLLPPRKEVEQDDSNTQHFYNQANRFLDTFARHRCMSAAIYALWSRVVILVVRGYPLTMETAVLEDLEQVEEDLGGPGLLIDGHVGIYCRACQHWLKHFEQYRLHVDSTLHRRNRVAWRRRAAKKRWEAQRHLLRRELGLEQ